MKLKIIKLKNRNLEKGFSLFIAVVIMGALLLAAYSISYLSSQELSLTTSNRESQYAYFAADAGIECALYWDSKSNPTKFDPSTSGSPISCNGQSISTGAAISGTTTPALIGGGGGAPVVAALINTGGGAYTDTLSQNWAADNGFTGGSTFSTGSSIANTSDPTLYQSERYGDMTYTISGLNPGGNYTVILKFAEIFFSSSGSRVFNVNINGAPALTNFDIVQDAGSSLKADDKSFSAIADLGGNITIQFVSIAGFNNPKISAIEVSTVAGGNPTSAFGFTMSSAQNTSNACVVVTVTKDGIGGTDINSYGYNTCNTSDPKRVERGIEVKY